MRLLQRVLILIESSMMYIYRSTSDYNFVAVIANDVLSYCL